MERTKNFLNSLNKFKSNPSNAHISNNGNSNTIVNGDNNKVEINNYNEKPKHIYIKEDHQHIPEIHLTTHQQAKIQELVKEIGDMCNGLIEKGHYKEVYLKLNKKFKSPKYSLILQKDFQNAIKHLNKEKMIFLKQLMYLDASRYKHYMIPKLYQQWSIKKNTVLEKYRDQIGCEVDLLSFAIFITGKHKKEILNFSVDDLNWLYKELYKIKV